MSMWVNPIEVWVSLPVENGGQGDLSGQGGVQRAGGQLDCRHERKVGYTLVCATLVC